MARTPKEQKKIRALVDALVERTPLLNQYALWLETSEKNTVNRGGDVYNMLVGAMQVLSDVDFIPGVGWQNFVEVVGEVQTRTGLDLGLCKFLDYREESISVCKAKSCLYVSSLKGCLPPDRGNCGHRILKKLATIKR